MKNRLFSLFALLALASMAVFGADVSGKWQSEAQGKGGPQTLTLKQSGSSLTGSIEGGRGGAVDIANGKVDGDKVTFDVTREFNGNSFTTKYSLTASGNTLKGSADTAGRGPRDITFTKQ